MFIIFKRFHMAGFNPGCESSRKNKRVRFKGKYVHLTVQKLTTEQQVYSKEIWLSRCRSFRPNIKAICVAIEDNFHKGKHLHIFLQFSTKPDLSRKQFVEHFQTNSLCITTPKGRRNIESVLGYVSKTGNSITEGVFSYRENPISQDTDVLRFLYQVKTINDADQYFVKIINESYDKFNVIETYSERSDAIGAYLRSHPAFCRAMIRLETGTKARGISLNFKGFPICLKHLLNSESQIYSAYCQYLLKFPEILAKYHAVDRTSADCKLEKDFKDYIENDMHGVMKILELLEYAVSFKYNRPLKSLNLWIWSRLSGFGKTRLISTISRYIHTYRLPDDQYYLSYTNGIFTAIVSDEAKRFITSRDYSHLKLFLEGQNVELNRKLREKIMKHDNPLIIMSENMSLRSVFLHNKKLSQDYTEDVIKSRVLEIEFRSRATLHFLCELLSNSVQFPL